MLGLAEDQTLCYQFSFENVTFGGGEQKLATFTVAAPTTDVVLELVTARLGAGPHTIGKWRNRFIIDRIVIGEDAVLSLYGRDIAHQRDWAPR